MRVTGANRNDSQEALAMVDAIPPLHGERGRPRQRPDCVLGDRGYDAAAIRRGLRIRYIVPLLAMRRTAHGSGLGRLRWSSSAHSPGSVSFAACECGTKSGPTSTRRSSRSGALICWQSLRRRWRTAERMAAARRPSPGRRLWQSPPRRCSVTSWAGRRDPSTLPLTR
jgi:Transposase DDE domain